MNSEIPKHESPFSLLGPEAVAAISLRFYEAMADSEQALAAVHKCDAEGRVDAATQLRFALFLVGWLGGPQLYVEEHGHPRLRMRHAHLKIDRSMRDAWLRCMATALDEQKMPKALRAYLDERFYTMADHLVNV